MIVNHGKETPAVGGIGSAKYGKVPRTCTGRNVIMTGEPMADEPKKQTVTLEELVVSNLAMTDALAKLMIAKGVITDEEFKAQLGAERANYLAVLKRLH
jgi:hypothetical protein